MNDEIGTIHLRADIRSAHERLSKHGTRSIIVNDEDVPVGRFDPNALSSPSAGTTNRKVGRVILREMPLLTQNMTTGEVRDLLAKSQTDRFPVVDEWGAPVGELTRAAPNS